MTIKKLGKNGWNFKAETVDLFRPSVDKVGSETFKIKSINPSDGSGLAICIGPANCDCNCLNIKSNLFGISGDFN